MYPNQSDDRPDVETTLFLLPFALQISHPLHLEVLFLRKRLEIQARTSAKPQSKPSDRFLMRDRDTKFGETFTQSVSALGMEPLLRAYRSPWQNGFAERLIGSIRRECLDHVIVLNETHLRGILQECVRYYNTQRTSHSDQDSWLDHDSDGIMTSDLLIAGEAVYLISAFRIVECWVRRGGVSPSTREASAHSSQDPDLRTTDFVCRNAGRNRRNDTSLVGKLAELICNRKSQITTLSLHSIGEGAAGIFEYFKS